MLYVHPAAVGQGAGAAHAPWRNLPPRRGAKELTVDASDTARDFFAKRGFSLQRRNTIVLRGEWIANTTMTKQLAAKEKTKETAP